MALVLIFAYISIVHSLNSPPPTKVAVVTGASRGIGKGISLELSREGYTTYITGQTMSGPLSLEQTASEAAEAGGGPVIPVQCDHNDDSQVASLFSRVLDDCGRLDLLVNNAFSLPSNFEEEGAQSLFNNFWELPNDAWDSVHGVGLRSHYVASKEAVPVMMRTRSLHKTTPKIFMISSFGGVSYTFNVAYGVAKCAVDRLAKDMAVELKPEGIATASLWPGVVMTENMKKTVESGDWDKFVGISLDDAETVSFTGKAVVALANDDDGIMTKTGSVQIVAELAEEYGFTDEGGKQPLSIRSLRFLIPNYAVKEPLPTWVKSLIPNFKLPLAVMANGNPNQ
ncbi:hypothetical protein TrCOL_g1224 [Triparma columacea]|uniref:Dehydrogenase/reductase SDR family member 1 n=1 Tax=Triparma columacea TaxID=722753 RepID=A0A9W7GLX8_9STRA|nr:hypothetical protein TrCOL_g1224 [Triparma columacea]